MRCAYYCCGDAFDLKKVSEYFTVQGSATKLHEPEVLLIKLGAVDDKNQNFMFMFSFGCIAFWGLDQNRENDILRSLTPFLSQPFDTYIFDSCKYNNSTPEQDDTMIDEESDTIALHEDDPYLKLSISYGLCQSVKLTFFENSVDKSIEANKHIPREIIRTGKIQYSRKNLAIKIGELLEERNLINLHSTILDTPEFFWRRPKYEPYYEMAVNFMDIEFRLSVLNKRLEVLHDLYGVLSNELQHLHTSRLEIIIILLILIEVIVVLMKEVAVLI